MTTCLIIDLNPDTQLSQMHTYNDNQHAKLTGSDNSNCNAHTLGTLHTPPQVPAAVGALATESF